MPHDEEYHHSQSSVGWQTEPLALGSPRAGGQSSYNPSMGSSYRTPIAYMGQMQYTEHPRENGSEGASNRMYPPPHKTPQGAPFNSQPMYSHGREHYNPHHYFGSQRESAQPRPQSNCAPVGYPPGQHASGGGPPLDDTGYEDPRSLHGVRDMTGGRRDLSMINRPELSRPTHPSLGRRGTHSSPSARTSLGGGASREQQGPLKDPSDLIHPNNSPELLRTNSRKSSPPYMLSQRKQHRLEEKSYLKAVKISIAEGRVPQVRLEQSNTGDIIQYKSQFLNALKLAAFSLVPNAVIDVKNPSTMQEIMKEVKQQFIIEKPLPEGMVEGFLQRLYKRNRAIYHRHWTVHGDQSKPDECTPAAWLQLVDYWKSLEGSAECERNKANASAKKNATVRYPTHSHKVLYVGMAVRHLRLDYQ